MKKTLRLVLTLSIILYPIINFAQSKETPIKTVNVQVISSDNTLAEEIKKYAISEITSIRNLAYTPITDVIKPEYGLIIIVEKLEGESYASNAIFTRYIYEKKI